MLTILSVLAVAATVVSLALGLAVRAARPFPSQPVPVRPTPGPGLLLLGTRATPPTRAWTPEYLRDAA